MLFDFELGNSVWGKAKIPPTKAVNLWLGADVMVEYPIDEAQQLLVRSCCKANSCLSSPRPSLAAANRQRKLHCLSRAVSDTSSCLGHTRPSFCCLPTCCRPSLDVDHDGLQEPCMPTQETNLKNCKANMSTTDKDLATIREFKTTTEVRTAVRNPNQY